jgi:hypothetical protein
MGLFDGFLIYVCCYDCAMRETIITKYFGNSSLIGRPICYDTINCPQSIPSAI